MHDGPAELLHGWHDFYLLVGTAGATLVGLMFVAASIGSRYFNEQRAAGMNTFISPTVVHFSSVFFLCVLAVAPAQTWLRFAVLLAAGGIVGALYSGRVLTHLILQHRFEVDLVDRAFYALIPALGYLLVLAAGVLLAEQSAWGLDLFALALVILLASGIRNAWDMTVWITLHSDNPPEATTPPQSTTPPQP